LEIPKMNEKAYLRPHGAARALLTETARGFIALVTGGTVALFMVGAALGAPGSVAQRLVLCGFVLCMAAVAYYYAGRRPRQAVVAMVWGIWLAAAANVVLRAGIYTGGLVFLAVPIVAAGWLLGRRWLAAMTGATVAFLAAISLAQQSGWGVTEALSPPVNVAFNWILGLVVGAAFIDRAHNELTARAEHALHLSDRLEQQLETSRKQHAQLHAFMEAIPAAVVEYGPDWRVRRCNQRYASFFQTTPQALEHKTWQDIANTELAMQTEGLQEKLQTGQRLVARLHYTEPREGRTRWVEMRGVPDMQGGSMQSCVVAVVDITPVVEAEQALHQRNARLSSRVSAQAQALETTRSELLMTQETLLLAEAKAAVSTLVASVSHELNTPIGNSVLVASGMADAIRSLRSDVANATLSRSGLDATTSTLQEGVGLLLRNLERVKTLMQQFKQVSTDQASEKRRHFDLSEVVADTVAALQPSLKQRDHVVELELEEGIGVDSYPGAIGQIVINLINNAYMHAFAPDTAGRVEVNVSAVEQGARLTVRDNGVGMDEQVQKRLFEPFFSTRFGDGGSGLGMSIVRHLVRKTLGGSITVESAPGQGTCFVVTLPVRAPDAA
jgi:PAS domain S-box-containing protein